MKKLIAILLTLAMVAGVAACSAPAAQPAPAAPAAEPAPAAPAAPAEPAASGDPYADLDAIELIGADSAGVGAAAQLCGELIASKVAEITGGKLTISYFPNGALGGDADLQQQMIDGDIDIVLCQTAPTVSFVPEVAIFDLPCVFAAYDAKTINKVLNDSAFYDAMSDAYGAKGINILGFLQGATYRLTTSDRALNTLEDFKGLTIRTMENKYHMAFWSNWGANPTPLAWAEVFIALQQGLMDAEENAADTVASSSFWEVQDYLCMTNHILYCNQVMMNSDKYTSLHPAYQAALDEAVDFALAEIGAQLTEINDTNVAKCKEMGMEIIDYDDDFYAQLKTLAQPTYEMIAGEVSNDLVNLLQSELEAAK